MAKDMDVIEDMDAPSSERTEDVAQIVTNTVTDEADAKSSTAEDASSEGALSVVRDVVEARKEETEPGSSPEGEEKVEEETVDREVKAPDNENYTDVPFHKHRRFQEVLHRAKAAEGDAQRYRNIEGFLQTNGLEATEAAEGLEIMALAKRDPSAAWQRIRPWVEQVLVAAGEVVPNDLQQRVQAGEITRELAVELSRTRAQTQSFTTRQQFEQQLATQAQQRQQQAAVMGAAESWKNERFIKDPNFADKQAAFHKELVYLTAVEGEPDTPEKVLDQLNRAYRAVNAAVRAPAPQPDRKPPVQPVRGGQTAGASRPEPKSTLDIIRANRRAV